MQSSSYKKSITQVAYYNTFHFLRNMHFRCAKCLFTNIQKQKNTLKVACVLREMQTLQTYRNKRIR